MSDQRKPEYLFRLPDGRLIYVSVDAINYTYDSFRLFIGDASEMHQMAITRVERFRDGGTTRIETAEWELASPSPLRGDSKPWWHSKQGKSEELVKLDPAQFVISESPGGVTILPAGESDE